MIEKITDNLLDNFITVMPAPKTHDYIRIRTNMSILNWKKMRYLYLNWKEEEEDGE